MSEATTLSARGWWSECSRTGTEPMVFIQQIHRLYHPCTKCTYGTCSADIQGIVTSFTEKEKYFHCGLDDGTGMIYVRIMKARWKFEDPVGDRLLDALKSQLQVPVPCLGDCVNIRGRIFRAFGELEIITSEFRIIADVDEEIRRINDVIDINEKVYSSKVIFPRFEADEEKEIGSKYDQKMHKTIEKIMRRILNSNHATNLQGIHLRRLLREVQSVREYRNVTEEGLLSIVDILVEKSHLVWVGPYRYGLLR